MASKDIRYFTFSEADFENFNSEVRRGIRNKLKYQTWKAIHRAFENLKSDEHFIAIYVLTEHRFNFYKVKYDCDKENFFRQHIADFSFDKNDGSFFDYLTVWYKNKVEQAKSLCKDDEMSISTTSSPEFIVTHNTAGSYAYGTTTTPNYVWNTTTTSGNIYYNDYDYHSHITNEIHNIIAKENEKNEPLKSNKENNKMANSMFPNFDFGPVKENRFIRLSAYGLAVKNKDEAFVAYDKANDCLMNVDIFNISGDNLFYKIPVAIEKITVGDIVVHAHTPMFVIEILNSSIKVVDPLTGERKEIMPTRNMFGFNFVTKVVSLLDGFGGIEATSDNPFGNVLPFLMMNGEKGIDTKSLLMCMMMNKGQMDFSNPLMLMAMCNDKGNSDFVMLMLMSNMMKQEPPSAK